MPTILTLPSIPPLPLVSDGTREKILREIYERGKPTRTLDVLYRRVLIGDVPFQTWSEKVDVLEALVESGHLVPLVVPSDLPEETMNYPAFYLSAREFIRLANEEARC